MKKLLMAMLLLPTVIFGDYLVVDGIGWRFDVSFDTARLGGNDSLCRAISYTTKGAIKIPSSFGRYPVTVITKWAFESCSELTSVTIPSSVTHISNSPFMGCSGLMEFIVDPDNPAYCSRNRLLLTKDGETLVAGINGDVEIPACVTSIGQESFWGCRGLLSVIMPEGVTTVGEGAFRYCTKLASVTIPPNVTNIGDFAFLCCSGLSSVEIPGRVGSIGKGVFEGCEGLSSVTIFEGVTHIGECAFEGCIGLESVMIPSSVTLIDQTAFDYCYSLKTIKVDHGDAVRVRSLLAESGVDVAALTFVEKKADGGPYIEKQDGIEWTYFINGGRAFVGSEDASDACAIPFETTGAIRIPAVLGGCPVWQVWDWAFAYCTGIESVRIPDGVWRIGGYAFHGCSSLESVTIPSSVVWIGESAFEGCSGLKSVSIPPKLTSIGARTFEDCKALESVVIPAGVTSIGDGAFGGCSGLLSAEIPVSVTRIGDGAFRNCSGLETVAISSNVTSIGRWAFIGCSGTKRFYVDESNPLYSSRDGLLCSKNGRLLIAGVNGDVAIPSIVTNIGDGAFCNYSGLKSITIPPSVTSIEDEAFANCSGLESVTIPTSVTSIRPYVFKGCAGLKSVTIPSSVVSLGSCSFFGCSGLKSVTIPSSVTSIGNGAFGGCDNLASVYVDKDDTERVRQMLVDSGFDVTKLTFVEPLEDGGPYTETTSDGITWTFYVENGVSIVGAGSLDGSAIPRDTAGVIKIPSTLGGHPVTSIEDSAFSGCSELTSVTIPEGVTGIGDYAFSRCVQLRSVTIPSSMAYIGSGAFATGSTLDKVVVSDLESYASICFAGTTANPRNNAEALYVGNELRNEKCRVSYALISDDMYDYYWYAAFNGYSETWTISDDGQTASCDVPVGSTICFDDLSGGAITISEWGDHAFDGWDGDGVCVVSDTEVVAKWRVKTLEEVLGYLLYSGSAWGKQQYFFFDANSGCLRSQGELCFGADSESDEYSSYSDIVDELKRTGQLSVVMVGYDENGWEVTRAKFPVVKIMGQNTWTAELSDISQVRYVSFLLAHSYYEGTYNLCDSANGGYILEDVSDVEVRSPNVWHIELEDPYYYCYNQRSVHGYDGTYDQNYYRTSMNGIKTGDVLYVSCRSQYWYWDVWHNNDFLYVNMDCGQGVSDEVYGEHDGIVQGAPSFMWVVPSASPEEAREHRVVTFETSIRSSRWSLYYYYYDIEIDPDIVTHQIDLNYGLYCDWNQMEDSPSELIVDDGLLPDLPKVFPLPGWRFVGWSPDSSLPVTEDIEYIAQYEPITYGITFEDVKGCENANTNAYTVEDEIIFLPLADLPDWHFDGWSPASIPTGSTGDVTVVAQWRPIETTEIVGTWSEPRTFEYDGKVHGVDYSARLDVMDWPLNVVTQGMIRAVNVGEYAATAMAETVGVPETDSVYYRCAAVTNECNWTITPKPVTKLQIDYVSTAMIANGQQQKPQIVVRDVERGVVLTSADYTLAYENNVEPGKGIARITGKGNYGGETTIEFPIVAGVSPAEGLNMDGGTFEIVGETDWVADNAVTHDGYASMRSGVIGDNETSALTTVVHGAGTVSFWWKVSSQHFDELELDRLEFYVDGVRKEWINGEVDWTKVAFLVEGAGPHMLSWVYAKDMSRSEGADCGWVDEVCWEKIWLPGDWLNDVDRAYTSSGVAWVPDSAVSTDDVGSMRSGVCAKGETSSISSVFERTGTLTFKWKCSCVEYGEYRLDSLACLVDGEEIAWINGEKDWAEVCYRIIGNGPHTVTWIFSKTSSEHAGSDCGWLDDVLWDSEPVVEPVVTNAITYVGLEGAANTNVTQFTTNDLPLVLGPVEREGYVFLGWTPNGGVIPAGTVTNVTFAANWEEIVEPPEEEPIVEPVVTNTITYVGLEGAANTNVTEFTTNDLPLVLGPVEREGYMFLGWTPQGGVIPAGTVTNVSFTATWEEIVEPPPVEPPEDPVGPTTPTNAPPTVVDETETHVDVEKGEVAPFADAAAVYDGLLYEGEKVVGSVQVKVAKGKVDKKSGVFSAKVTATVQLAGEAKKLSFKGGSADQSGNVSEMTDKNGNKLAITVGVKGLGGEFRRSRSDTPYRIDGARNVFSGKSAADKDAAGDAVRLYQGVYNVAFDGGTLSVSVDKKGKAKIAGTVEGNKVNATSQLVVGKDAAVVSVVIVKKVNVSFCLWVTAGGTVEVRGVDSATSGQDSGRASPIADAIAPFWVAGKAGTLADGAKFWLDEAAVGKLKGWLTELYADYLPKGLAVAQDGKKWIVADGAKAGKLVLAKGATTIDTSKLGENPSGLKLSYKEKDGTFKGAFKVYNLENGKIKAYTASVTGVMIGNTGYGTATIKKLGTVSVKVSKDAPVEDMSGM